MDLPAHGSRANERLTMQSAVRAVAEILHEQCPSKKAIIFGYSLGAYVAIHFSKDYPEICSNIILGGCCGDLSNWQSKVYYNAMSALTKLPGSVLWTLLPSTPGLTFVSREALQEIVFRSGIDFENSDQCSEIMLQLNIDLLAEALTHFKGQIFFINAEKDDRKLESKFLDAAPSNSRLHIIKGASGLLPIQTNFRDELNEVVIAFLQEIVS